MTIEKLFSTIILVAFLVTIFLAMGSYAAYKWRESRRPRREERERSEGPVYFERITLGAEGEDDTRNGSARWLVLAALTVIGLSVALAARGERTSDRAPGPKRFAGATTVIPMRSILPPARLPSPVRVALVRDPAAASYYRRSTTFDSILARWTAVLEATGADVRTVSPGQLASSDARVIVLPSSQCLSVATREAIERARARGQGIIATGALGTKDARCRRIGYGLLVALTGASRVDTLEKRDITYVTFPTGSALSAGMLPGSRLELDPAPSIALRRPGRDAFFSSFSLRPEPARDAPLLDGAVVRSRYGRARVAYWGFELTGVNALPWDRDLIQLLVRNAVAWTARLPVAELEPWPRGKIAAAVLAQDVEDQFTNARFALDSLRAAGVRGTYFLTSELARRHEALTRAIAEQDEIGTHSENHRLLGGEPANVQRRRLALTQVHLRDLLGEPVSGLRPPEEQFDTATLAAWLEAGGTYVFGANNSRAAAPELLEVNGDTVVLLGRANVDDFDAASLASRGSLDEIVKEYLVEYQKVRALGGLYLLSYHSQLLARPELVPALARIARRIRADTAVWLTTANDVVEWWSKRAAVEVRATRPDARSIRVEVRNTGPDTVPGLVARVTLGDGERAAGTVRELRTPAGTLRFVVPALPPGGQRSFRFTISATR
ncbi:MAG: polysaccharide deacetylase family protein [Gemmatimonadaceae bacterium]